MAAVGHNSRQYSTTFTYKPDCVQLWTRFSFGFIPRSERETACFLVTESASSGLCHNVLRKRNQPEQNRVSRFSWYCFSSLLLSAFIANFKACQLARATNQSNLSVCWYKYLTVQKKKKIIGWPLLLNAMYEKLSKVGRAEQATLYSC